MTCSGSMRSRQHTHLTGRIKAKEIQGTNLRPTSFPQMRFLTLLLATISLALTASAHPGEFEPDHNSPERREFLHAARGTIANCQDQLIARGDVHRAVERRAALAEKLRHELGLTRRGARRAVADVLAKDHKSNRTGLTASTPAKDLFTGNLQCLLQAEVTEGPYCVLTLLAPYFVN